MQEPLALLELLSWLWKLVDYIASFSICGNHKVDGSQAGAALAHNSVSAQSLLWLVTWSYAVRAQRSSW